MNPRDAVTAWWTAMANGDIAALADLAAEDYMSVGGPQGRELGRDAFLAGARQFFADARIDAWAIEDLEVRDLGDAAVCSYTWSETGRHRDVAFDLAGMATDVLVRIDGGWLHQARHVSMPPDPGRPQ